jgi:alpha-mannosidase
VTLHRLPSSTNTLFIRIAHQFAEGEDSTLSKTATVDLAALLTPFKPKAETLTELNLSGNQLQGDMLKNKVQWNTVQGPIDTRAASAATNSMIVELSPMQFRTFVVELDG